MRKVIATVAFLAILPAAALGMAGNYGSGSAPGMGRNGNSMDMAKAREELEAGLRDIQNGQYADALPHLRRALMAAPGNADILNYLGFASRMAGNYDDSLDYYQRALARNPDHKGAHEYLGELYLMLHKPDDAKQQLAELTRLCPDGCVEKDTLTQSIAKYEAAAATAPPAAPGAAPPAQTNTSAPPQQPTTAAQPH